MLRINNTFRGLGYAGGAVERPARRTLEKWLCGAVEISGARRALLSVALSCGGRVHAWRVGIHTTLSQRQIIRRTQTTTRQTRIVWNWRDYLWERGFANLLKFKRREGHCRVPSARKEENHNLGYWVSTQRKNQKQMSAERKARLNKIKFAWKLKPGRFAYRD